MRGSKAGRMLGRMGGGVGGRCGVGGGGATSRGRASRGAPKSLCVCLFFSQLSRTDGHVNLSTHPIRANGKSLCVCPFFRNYRRQVGT